MCYYVWFISILLSAINYILYKGKIIPSTLRVTIQGLWTISRIDFELLSELEFNLYIQIESNQFQMNFYSNQIESVNSIKIKFI